MRAAASYEQRSGCHRGDSDYDPLNMTAAKMHDFPSDVSHGAGTFCKESLSAAA
jgi:hypothetical protein